MDKQLAFRILEINETKDEKVIKKAYRSKLSVTNPEDKPEEFKRLREAYDYAIQCCRQEEEETKEPVTEIDFFMEDVKKVYRDIRLRYDVNNWKRLFENPLCVGLDTSYDVRRELLSFFDANYQLDHDMLKVFDDVFDIVADEKALSQEFPQGYISYLIEHIRNEDTFPYKLLRYTCDNIDEADPDKYIATYASLMHAVDDLEGKAAIANGQEEQTFEEEITAIKNIERDLSAYNVYHPYEDAYRLRFHMLIKDVETQQDIYTRLEEFTGKDPFVDLCMGESLWERGHKDTAAEHWKKIIEVDPEHYRALFHLVKYDMYKEKYYDAKKTMYVMLELSDEDERVHTMIEEVNEKLIPEYAQCVAHLQGNENFSYEELVVELGWCYLQNNRMVEAEELLRKHNITHLEYEYNNIKARLLYRGKKYTEALPYMIRWKDIVYALEDDGTEETKKRMGRKAAAAGLLAEIYCEIGDRDNAVANCIMATENARDIKEQMNSRRELAYIYRTFQEYSNVVAVCDEMISIAPQYYIAYLMRQEICLLMKNYQSVVDDYHAAIEIFPSHYQPYMYAAEAFMANEQYEDALIVFERARENGAVLSPRAIMLELLCRGRFTKDAEERNKMMEQFQQLYATSQMKVKPGNWDIESDADICFAMGVFTWGVDYDKSRKYIREAMDKNPDKIEYIVKYAEMWIGIHSYENALKQYEKLPEEEKHTKEVLCGRARCYKGLKNEGRAIELYEEILASEKAFREACEEVSDFYLERYKDTCRKEFFEKAVAYATRQLEVYPNSYNFVCRGIIYVEAMEIKEAIADFKTAIRYEEDNWAAWFNLGRCYQYSGQYETAIEKFEKAVECIKKYHIKNPLPYEHMGGCYQSLKRYDEALECHTNNMELMDGDYANQIYKRIAEVYELMGMYDMAIDAYSKFGGYGYNFYLARVYHRKGDKKKAIQHFNKGINVDNRMERLYVYIDFAKYYLNLMYDYRKSIQMIKEAFQLARSQRQLFDCALLAARAYYMKGDKVNARKYAGQAREHFEKMGEGTKEEYLAYKPKRCEHLQQWGWIELCLGNVEGAIRLFMDMDKQMLCYDCNFGKCFDSPLYLGYLYMSQGDYNKAEEYFRETIHRFPGCLDARAALSHIGSNLGYMPNNGTMNESEIVKTSKGDKPKSRLMQLLEKKEENRDNRN